MEYEIGKVTQFDGSVGTVVSQNGSYLFLKDDIETNAIAVGRLVAFRGEEKQGIKRAYFVIGIEKIENMDTIKTYEKVKQPNEF